MPVEANPERTEIYARAQMLSAGPRGNDPMYTAVVVERAIDRLTAAVERLVNAYEREHRDAKRRRGK